MKHPIMNVLQFFGIIGTLYFIPTLSFVSPFTGVAFKSPTIVPSSFDLPFISDGLKTPFCSSEFGTALFMAKRKKKRKKRRAPVGDEVDEPATEKAAPSIEASKAVIAEIPKEEPSAPVEVDVTTETTTQEKKVQDDGDDELPEFDMVEDVDIKEEEASPPPKESSTPASPTANAPASLAIELDENDPAVLEAMRGSGSASSLASTKDLLRARDRSVEQAFEFEDVADKLPTFGAFQQRKQQASLGIDDDDGEDGQGMGKKRARDEARKAAAIAAREEEEKFDILDPIKGLLRSLPLFGEQEDAVALQLLELGTWTIMFILVVWEIYINSPFFERAAPMAPVVFEFLP